MSDLIQEMITRRSVRKYKPDMIPKETIDKIIEAVCMRRAAWDVSRSSFWLLQIRKSGTVFLNLTRVSWERMEPIRSTARRWCL